jgi:hypothetical protein
VNGLAAGLRDEDDNMGAGPAREAAESLTEAAGKLMEAAEHVGSLASPEDSVLLVGLQRRLTEAAVAAEEARDAAERLHVRQLSAAMMREAHRRIDYAAGWEACLAFRRGLRAV